MTNHSEKNLRYCLGTAREELNKTSAAITTIQELILSNPYFMGISNALKCRREISSATCCSRFITIEITNKLHTIEDSNIVHMEHIVSMIVRLVNIAKVINEL